ncbi:hypothetical protein [Streptomyces sp. NHF165]|uniref:hypothetical protein n=1 Tax=Streptomyces sp. NHF165 TaxID=2175864 RepID=UPI00135CDB4C|nr:hypothetical protein [Streptomyces sp. NHF165]
MAGVFSRLISPLRPIGDPTDLVLEADRLIKDAEKNKGSWALMTAYAGMASAKIELARYLQEYRD